MEIIDRNVQARVHSIETCGLVDGPGIRFVIFMQGCPLRCKYCHNRDSWSCNTGEIINLDSLYKRILNYKEYFELSKGGVTATGGEPLLQPKFLTNLFKKLQKKAIHTALDTSGMIKINDDIKELLKVTDLVLLDIKHINDEKCKELVGHSNKNELDFARYLSDNNIPVWIRQVIIPGITDDKEDLLKLKEFIESLSNVKKIEILPYHDLGKFKWEKLNINYELENVRQANEEDITRAKEILDIKK